MPILILFDLQTSHIDILVKLEMELKFRFRRGKPSNLKLNVQLQFIMGSPKASTLCLPPA